MIFGSENERHRTKSSPSLRWMGVGRQIMRRRIKPDAGLRSPGGERTRKGTDGAERCGIMASLMHLLPVRLSAADLKKQDVQSPAFECPE